MASTRDIRRRIKSVKNTAQITKAMQMVAAAKMRKAQQAALAGRPYADLMNEVLAGAAVAQPMGPGMMGGPGAGRGPGFGRGMNDPATYLAGLKTELGITPAQEPAWGEYAETVQGMATQMQAMHASVFERMQTATWQERQEMMNGMFASRTEAHRIVQEAAQKLLPALTPEQRTHAATSLPGLIGPAGGMGEQRGMGIAHHGVNGHAGGQAAERDGFAETQVRIADRRENPPGHAEQGA